MERLAAGGQLGECVVDRITHQVSVVPVDHLAARPHVTGDFEVESPARSANVANVCRSAYGTRPFEPRGLDCGVPVRVPPVVEVDRRRCRRREDREPQIPQLVGSVPHARYIGAGKRAASIGSFAAVRARGHVGRSGGHQECRPLPPSRV